MITQTSRNSSIGFAKVQSDTTESVGFTSVVEQAQAIRLMNSAMMPKPGNYSTYEVDPRLFADLVKQADSMQKLDSYIGYPESVQLIAELTGVRVPMNRRLTDLNPGDVLLCVRLQYRVENPAHKRLQKPTINDYAFFVSLYSTNS